MPIGMGVVEPVGLTLYVDDWARTVRKWSALLGAEATAYAERAGRPAGPPTTVSGKSKWACKFGLPNAPPYMTGTFQRRPGFSSITARIGRDEAPFTALAARMKGDPQLSTLTRLWAAPLYRVVHDPDGRPKALRKRRQF